MHRNSTWNGGWHLATHNSGAPPNGHDFLLHRRQKSQPREVSLRLTAATGGDLTSSRNEMERLGWVFEDYDGNVCLPSEFYGAHAISRRYIPGGNPNHNDFGTLGLYGDSSQTYSNGYYG